MKRFLTILFPALLVLFALVYWSRNNSPNSTNQTAEEVESHWQTYNNSAVSFEYPTQWVAGELQTSGSANEINFTDPQEKFRLTYEEQPNFNQKTGKSYSDFNEYMEIGNLMPYRKINEYELYEVLPRAGSEHINSVVFFSNEKPILTYQLETLTQNEDDIKAGQELFSFMVNSFEILK